MSGQLVGEVIAAADELRERGLSARGFHALIAIAEKAETHSRSGSVRWDHIRAGLFGASMSTAKRAVADLQGTGLIRLVKRGFNNHAGRAAAPIYEILAVSQQLTQVTHSVDSQQLTQVTHSHGGQRVKSGGRTDHPDDLLDGPIDELLARRPAACPGCRGDGWVLGDDGIPVEPAVKCTRCGYWRRAS